MNKSKQIQLRDGIEPTVNIQLETCEEDYSTNKRERQHMKARIKGKCSQAWWLMGIIPVNQEAEAGRL